MLQQHVPYVFRRMLQVFYLDICYNDYIGSVYSKCFICFSRMLQLFHLSVAKVDLNVGLFSEEERASAGAMAASTVSWGSAPPKDAQASALAHTTRSRMTCCLRWPRRS